MERKIKLSKKQLESLTATQSQKAELLKQIQEVNTREGAIVDIILDVHGVTEPASALKLVGDELILTFPEAEKKAKKAGKVVQLEEK